MTDVERQASYGIVDPVALGALLTSARMWAGLPTVEAAAQRVQEMLGVTLDARVIAQMESAQQPVTFEAACALAYVYGVPGGVNHLFDALREPLGASLKRAQWPVPAHKKGSE